MAKKPNLKVVESTFQCSPEEREYFSSLHTIIDEIYSVATHHYEMSWSDLAKKAECSYLTVQKLGERETRYPRFYTVFKLARAVGWHIVVGQDKKITKKEIKKAIKKANKKAKVKAVG